MPKYLVLETSFINNRIHEAGDEIDYDGIPSTNLKPIESLPKEVIEKAENADQESQERIDMAASAGVIVDKKKPKG